MEVTNDLGKSSFDHMEVVESEREVWEESEEMESIEHPSVTFGWEEGEKIDHLFDENWIEWGIFNWEKCKWLWMLMEREKDLGSTAWETPEA